MLCYGSKKLCDFADATKNFKESYDHCITDAITDVELSRYERFNLELEIWPFLVYSYAFHGGDVAPSALLSDEKAKLVLKEYERDLPSLGKIQDLTILCQIQSLLKQNYQLNLLFDQEISSPHEMSLFYSKIIPNMIYYFSGVAASKEAIQMTYDVFMGVRQKKSLKETLDTLVKLNFLFLDANAVKILQLLSFKVDLTKLSLRDALSYTMDKYAERIEKSVNKLRISLNDLGNQELLSLFDASEDIKRAKAGAVKKEVKAEVVGKEIIAEEIHV